MHGIKLKQSARIQDLRRVFDTMRLVEDFVSKKIENKNFGNCFHSIIFRSFWTDETFSIPVENPTVVSTLCDFFKKIKWVPLRFRKIFCLENVLVIYRFFGFFSTTRFCLTSNKSNIFKIVLAFLMFPIQKKLF